MVLSPWRLDNTSLIFLLQVVYFLQLLILLNVFFSFPIKIEKEKAGNDKDIKVQRIGIIT